MFCAVIGDVIASREMAPEARAALQKRIAALLEEINGRWREVVAARFTLTLGDEFQGLLWAGWPVTDVVLTLQQALWPQRVRFGVGYGEVDTEIDPGQALGADGPAWHRARAGIDLLKKRGDKHFALCVRTGGPDEVLLDGLCGLLDEVAGGWSERQRQTVMLNRQLGERQNRVAEALGVGPSTVSRTLRAAHYGRWSGGLEALNQYLREAYDWPQQLPAPGTRVRQAEGGAAWQGEPQQGAQGEGAAIGGGKKAPPTGALPQEEAGGTGIPPGVEGVMAAEGNAAAAASMWAGEEDAAGGLPLPQGEEDEPRGAQPGDEALPLQAAQAGRNKGVYFMAQQQPRQALEAFEEALAALAPGGDEPPEALLLQAGLRLEAAGACMALGRWEEALAHYGAVLAMPELLGLPGAQALVAAAHQGSGLALLQKGQYVPSIRSLQRALALHEEAEPPSGAVEAALRDWEETRLLGMLAALVAIGNAYRGWGRWERAQQAYQQALQLPWPQEANGEAAGRGVLRAEAMAGLAEVENGQQRFAEALQSARQAVETLEGAGEGAGAAAPAQWQLALAYAGLQDRENAFAHWRLAAAGFEQLKKYDTIVEISEAMALRLQQDLPRAAECLAAAMEARKRV